MPDLRALLGDERYAAMHALARETYWSRGGTERDSFRMAVNHALEAVLPGLLAEAWDEGAASALHGPTTILQEGVTLTTTATPNPYRTEETR